MVILQPETFLNYELILAHIIYSLVNICFEDVMAVLVVFLLR